jgi:CelD/BcsL family acetyltransferase involved in cellulose biosynthesis
MRDYSKRDSDMTWTLSPATTFAAHAAEWQQLNTGPAATPLLDADFVGPLLAEYGEGKEMLARYVRDGQTLAMAILYHNRAGAWNTFQASQSPLGAWVQRPELDTAELADKLLRALPGFPLVLSVTQRDPMLAPRPADGDSFHTLDYIDTARITIGDSFDDYWATRGKNLRTNMKKQRAKLLKDGIEARMEASRSPEDVAAGVADYGRLESAGWKAEGGTAIHPDNDQGRFYQAMLENFCRKGQGCILRYWFGERLVAMNPCIEGNGQLIILKTTYDESVGTQFSPAMLLCEDICKEMFAQQRFERLEFYGRVKEWHRRWTDEVRTMYHVNHYRWPALLQLRALLNKRAAAREPTPVAAPQQQGTSISE